MSDSVAFLPPVRSIVAVAVGGAIGAVLRFAVSASLPTQPGRWPMGTFLENVVGAFLLGLLATLLLERWPAVRTLHPLVCTGILGSFTTFSNLMLEIIELIDAGQSGLAIAYATATLTLGLAAALAGMRLGQAWPPIVRKETS